MANANLAAMLRKFGSVTVMDVKIYDYKEPSGGGDWTLGTKADLGDLVTTIDSLKISNLNQEGPNKTATGGQNAEVLIKYGKTMRIEMQDALGRYDVMTNLFGIDDVDGVLVVTDRFAGLKTLVGETFFIDQKTGAKQPVYIVIPKFLPDSIFNFTGEAEGDVATFDINGDIAPFGKTAVGDVDSSGKYKPGGDNQFYLIYSKQAYDAVPQS